MRKPLYLFLLLPLAACGPSPEQVADKQARELCGASNAEAEKCYKQAYPTFYQTEWQRINRIATTSR